MQAYRIESLDQRGKDMALKLYAEPLGFWDWFDFKEYVNAQGWIFTEHGERIA